MKLKKIVAMGIAAALAIGLVGCSSIKITQIELEEIPEMEVGQTHEVVVMFAADKEDASVEAIEKATEKMEITYESSDEEVATVDENGVVTAIGEGEAEITVTADELTANTKVTVVAAQEKLDEEVEAEKVLPEKQEEAPDEKNNNATGTASGNVNGGNKNNDKNSSGKPAEKPSEQPQEKPAPAPTPIPQESPAPAPQPQPENTPAPATTPAPAPEQPSGGTPDAVIGSGPMDNNQMIEVPPQNWNEYEAGNAGWE